MCAAAEHGRAPRRFIIARFCRRAPWHRPCCLQPGMKTTRWRVLIVDDHAPSRAAVAEAVGAQGGTVVGNGSRVEDAVRLVDKHRPDVVLLAVGLPDGDGIEAARRVMTALPCPIVLLPSHTDPDITAGAGEAGALGFLLERLRHDELPPALEVALSRFRRATAVRRDLAD